MNASQATLWWANAAAEEGLGILDQHVGATDDWLEVERTGTVDFARALKETQLPVGSHLRALEIGCGAGRMTAALANRYGAVEALDVAPEFIRQAKSRCRAENVRFRLTAGDSLQVENDDEFDVAFSYEVFHYLDRDVLTRYVRDAYAALKPGGTLAVQLNTEAIGWRTRASRMVRWGLSKLGVRHWRGWPTDPSFCHKTYPVTWLLGVLEETGFEDCEAVQPGTRRTWLLAKKPTHSD